MVEVTEVDKSWFLIAVRRGTRCQNDVVILDYDPTWADWNIELHWEDTFDSAPPTHLEPGAYLWTGFTIGYSDEDDGLNVRGGNFTAHRTQSTAADKAMIAELKVQAFEALEQASDFAGQIDELNLAAAGKDARIAELEAEIASLRAQLAKVREAAQPFVSHVGKDGDQIKLSWGPSTWTGTLTSKHFADLREAYRAALSTIKGDE